MNLETSELFVAYHVDKQHIAEFGLKPGAFGRHNPIAIGYGHQFCHGGGV